MELLDAIKIILIGIIEGITEWLPISSTGHMIIFQNLWEKFFGGFWSPIFSEGFPNVFDYVIQFGAILAVVVVFWNKIFPFGLTKKDGKQEGKLLNGGITVKKEVVSMWLKVIVACIPAVLAILADELFENIKGDVEIILISSMLILYGVGFIVVERINSKKTPKVEGIENLTYLYAFLIGCFQVLASIPGTSRSGVTIIGALILGVSRVTAAEFTFFLAIPTMVGASGFKMLKLILDGGMFSMTEIWALLLGMAVAFAVSMMAIKLLMSFVRKHDFKPFGWYRIILGLALITVCIILP